MVILLKGNHTNLNLHVCVFEKDHQAVARKIYGSDRVNQQLKDGKVDTCYKCRFFPDLLQYCGVAYTHLDKDELKEYSPRDDYRNYIEYSVMDPVKSKLRKVYDNVFTAVYDVSSIMVNIKDFFTKPKGINKWIDMV